ncbi:hypothetical protein [Nocardia vermiculata]|uniref:Uncharacterized protein n=1 Tax=Nocardia vermiculata TaxID=257274 RepID=A0A846Y5Q8_9NOCA|nr:hypothetical protein [Nocardia vermiculata]NKY54177.1 hypothetical protein [Nocardia vermiculata]
MTTPAGTRAAPDARAAGRSGAFRCVESALRRSDREWPSRHGGVAGGTGIRARPPFAPGADGIVHVISAARVVVDMFPARARSVAGLLSAPERLLPDCESQWRRRPYSDPPGSLSGRA